MRVLLDESIPIDFARDLLPLDAQTVIGLGWAGLRNGMLLRQAAGQFQVRAYSNRIDELRPLVPQITAAIAASEVGKIRVVGA